jgi:hypothetical protein
MTSGIYKRVKPVWNKGKKGLQVAWNKGIHMWENKENPKGLNTTKYIT